MERSRGSGISRDMEMNNNITFAPNWQTAGVEGKKLDMATQLVAGMCANPYVDSWESGVHTVWELVDTLYEEYERRLKKHEGLAQNQRN